MTYEQEHGIYGVIYCIKSPSGKMYVGQTIQFKTRMSQYKCAEKSDQPKLFHAIRKYGWNNMKVEVWCHCFDKQDLDSREKHLIKLFDLIKNGYNSKEGGANGRHGPETLMKMSASQKGRKHSEKTKDKIRAANKNKKVSEETKRKLSVARTGLKLSGPGLESFREWRKSHPVSEETKAKMRERCGALSGRYDPTVHSFKHRVTGGEFIGTKYDFRTKYDIPYQAVTGLFFKGRKSARNWILLQRDLKE